MDDIWHIKR